MPTLLDRLNGALAGWAAESPGSLCAVVDVGDQTTLDRLQDGALGAEPRFIHARVLFGGLPPEVMPALVPLAEKDWALRQRTAQIASEDAATGGVPLLCGWLRSSSTLENIGHAFEISLLRVAADGRHRYVFRHHDPRVRSCLGALLGPQWLAGLLHIPHEWLHVSPDGQLHRTARAASGDASEAITEAITETSAFQAIMRCGEINKAIRLASENGWAFETRGYRTADAALTRAEALGFGGAADRLAYMLHALTLGPHFDAHPAIGAALQEAAAHHGTYVQAMNGLPTTVWDSVAIKTAQE